MKKMIESLFQESRDVNEKSCAENVDVMIAVVEAIIEAFRNNKKVLLFGNGGSAADAQHVAAEFIGRFKKERKSLPAISLSTDTSILTSLGNDYGFDVIFSRQIEGLGAPGDVAFGISTSGNSPNVIKGIEKAKEMGLKTVSLTGRDGGALAKLTQMSLIVPATDTARIQESHVCIEHVICQLVEQAFAGSEELL